LEFFRRDPNDFLSRLVAMEETWLYHYYPETKQQSKERRQSGSPHPKKIPSAKTVMSVCLFARPHGKTRLHWTDFH
jgi:hypothetical protein